MSKYKKTIKYLLSILIIMVTLTFILSILTYYNILTPIVVKIITNIILFSLIFLYSFKCVKEKSRNFLVCFVFPIIIFNTLIYLLFINDNYLKLIVLNTLIILVAITGKNIKKR